MTHKETMTAILEYYFSGFKKEIIDDACNRILDLEPKFIAKSDGTVEQINYCEDCVFKCENCFFRKECDNEKMGHWIEHEHNKITFIECSECSSCFLRSYLTRNSYCPNCGVKMKAPRKVRINNG